MTLGTMEVTGAGMAAGMVTTVGIALGTMTLGIVVGAGEATIPITPTITIMAPLAAELPIVA